MRSGDLGALAVAGATANAGLMMLSGVGPLGYHPAWGIAGLCASLVPLAWIVARLDPDLT